MKLHQVPATEYFPRQNEEKVRSLSYNENSNSALQNATEYVNWVVITLWPLFLSTVHSSENMSFHRKYIIL